MKAIERLYEYLEFKGIKATPFEAGSGLSNGYLGKQLKRKADLGETILLKIIENCPDLNPVWLLLGNGSMLKVSSTERKEDTITNKNKVVKDIPVYTIDTTIEIIDLFGENQDQKPVSYINIPKISDCDGALYVKGDSMYPLLNSGDIVVYKKVKNPQENILWGEMYLTYINNDGNEFFFTRFLNKSERNSYVQFVSHNPHYQTVEFPVSSIKALALIKASVRVNV